MHSSITITTEVGQVNGRTVPRPMLAMSAAICSAISGCSSAPPDTALLPLPTPGAVHCAQQADNVLRVACDVTLGQPATVVVEITDGDRVRSVVGERGETHHLVVWGLRPERLVAWTVTADGEVVATGSLQTGSLPEAIRSDVVVAGDPLVDGVLVRGCGSADHLVVLDGGGEVVWYEDLSAHAPGEPAIVGYALSDAGVVAALGRDHLVEVTMQGERVQRVDLPALGVVGELHHDVAHRDGVLYGLYAYLHEGSVYDGVVGVAEGHLVVDIGTHELLAGLTIDGAPPPGVFDAYWTGLFGLVPAVSHANSVFVTDEGAIIVSLRLLDAIVAFDAAGVSQWVLAGSPSSPLPSSMVLGSDVDGDVGFATQHSAEIGPSGRLVFLDNGVGGESARALAVALDAAGGAATIEEVYPTDQVCPEQSSAYELEGGGALVTCASSKWIGGFQQGAASPSWTMPMACDDPPPGGDVIPRGIPVTFGQGGT